jgi:adenosylcobinamide-GDP ribazoletransferase
MVSTRELTRKVLLFALLAITSASCGNERAQQQRAPAQIRNALFRGAGDSVCLMGCRPLSRARDAAHTASRWTILPLCRWLPYARAEGQGKLVARQITGTSVLTGSARFLFLLSLLSWPSALVTIASTALVVISSCFYFKRKLGGITGDYLGAVNQITEVVLYLIAVLLAR